MYDTECQKDQISQFRRKTMYNTRLSRRTACIAGLGLRIVRCYDSRIARLGPWLVRAAVAHLPLIQVICRSDRGSKTFLYNFPMHEAIFSHPVLFPAPVLKPNTMFFARTFQPMYTRFLVEKRFGR